MTATGRRSGIWSLWPAGAAVLLVTAAGLLGPVFGLRQIDLAAPPFAGHYDVRLGSWTAVVVLTGVGLWTAAPVAQRLRWPSLLVVGSLAALAWSLALALVDGTRHGLRDRVTARGEYLDGVPRVDGVHSLLSTFTDFIADGPMAWPTQVSGHPPLLLLVLAGMDRIGLGGPWPFVVLCLVIGCTVVAATLVAVRAVADEATARACAPFVALAPGAIWLAVSADALYAAVAAWGIAALALGRQRGSLRWSYVGGLVLGLALFLSYGVAPLGAVAIVLLTDWRRLVAATAGVLTVVLAFLSQGFWWVTALTETLVRVRQGVGATRPYEYFLLADLACLVVIVGLPTVQAIARLPRRDALWRLVGACLFAVVVSDLTGASRGEVERIWLPFAPYLLVATARLPHPRRWLAVQIATGALLALVLDAKW